MPSVAREGSTEGEDEDLVGRRVGGKYVVEQVLGRGGMGCVALGRHEALGQKVAIKFMLPGIAEDAKLSARFLREARLAARLQSDHVVRVFDVGELEDGAPYMVMEYLEGHSLAEELIAKGPLPVATAVAYILQALEAIAEAHALGAVHRDLKPDNIFLARKTGSLRVVKVLDFGISKAPQGAPDAASNAEKHALTQTSMLLGSPMFMSPEQIRNAAGVDARSDIWSIGVVLYQLVEGHLPFRAGSVGELFGQIQFVDPEPMENAPADFEAVIQTCLKRDLEKRYRSVGELADALAPFSPRAAEKSVDVVRQLLQRSSADDKERVAVNRHYSVPPPAAAPGPLAATVAYPALEKEPTIDEPRIEILGIATEGEAPPPSRRGLFGVVAFGLVAAVTILVLSLRASSGKSTSSEVSGSSESVAVAPLAAPPMASSPVITPTSSPVATPPASVTPTASAPPAPPPAARPPVAATVSARPLVKRPPAATPTSNPAGEPDRGF